MQALALDPQNSKIALVQFAVLYRDGKKAANVHAVRRICYVARVAPGSGQRCGAIFLRLRKSDQHLDFDLDLAKSQSNENPVYYVQYAHARVCSVLEQWGEDMHALARRIYPR